MSMKGRLLGTLLSGLLLLGQQSLAQDFNRDGKDDLVLIQIAQDGSLQWQSFSFADNSLLSLGSFGSNGDHIALGNWSSPETLELGVIRHNNQSLTWKVQHEGAIKEEVFGNVPATVLAGGDFNGDGVNDAVTTKKRGKSLLWSVVPGFMTSQTPKNLRLGASSDVPFFFNDDHQSDKLAVAKRNGKIVTVLSRPLTKKTTKRLVLRNVSQLSRRPLPVKGPDGIDTIVFVTQEGGYTLLQSFRLNGKRLPTRRIFHTGEVIVGNYLDGPGEEVGVQNSGTVSFTVMNLRTGETTSVSTPQGIPVDLININTFSASSSPDPRSPDGSGQCVSENPKDGSEGFVWKPFSDTQHFAVAVLPKKYTGLLQGVALFTSGGEKIKDLVSKGVGNNNRTAWQDKSATGPEYKTKYGSIVVVGQLVSGGCVSYAIPDPSVRVD